MIQQFYFISFSLSVCSGSRVFEHSTPSNSTTFDVHTRCLVWSGLCARDYSKYEFLRFQHCPIVYPASYVSWHRIHLCHWNVILFFFLVRFRCSLFRLTFWLESSTVDITQHSGWLRQSDDINEWLLHCTLVQTMFISFPEPGLTISCTSILYMIWNERMSEQSSTDRREGREKRRRWIWCQLAFTLRSVTRSN